MNIILIGISMLIKAIAIRINVFTLSILSRALKGTTMFMKNISHYDEYDDDSANITDTEHYDKDNINANDSLSKLKDRKLKSINAS